MNLSDQMFADPEIADASHRRNRQRMYRQITIGLIIAAGGSLGALGRWYISSSWPTSQTGFPFDIFSINIVGCFLIGVLMVWIENSASNRQWLRPFLGVGVLGGFTTFSTYSVETSHRLVIASGTALVYLFASPLAALLAVLLGVSLTTRGLSLIRTISKGLGL